MEAVKKYIFKNFADYDKRDKIYTYASTYFNQRFCEYKHTEKSQSRLSTIKKMILPKISLYKALIINGYSKDEAYKITKTCLEQGVSKKVWIFHLFELPPNYFKFFKKMIRKFMNSDKWITEFVVDNEKNIGMDITKCLWFDTCKQCNVVELTKIFCDGDNLTFGSMKKIKFNRTKTLGYGDECCNFRFEKIK